MIAADKNYVKSKLRPCRKCGTLCTGFYCRECFLFKPRCSRVSIMRHNFRSRT